MKRLLFGIFLLSICACQKPTAMVVTTEKEEATPVITVSPADQAAIDDHLKKQAEANATVKHTAAGEILLREGYSFMKLMRDNSSKLYVNCVANGKVICLNLDTGFTNCAIADEVATILNLKTTESNLDLVAVGSERHKTRFGTISDFRVGDSVSAVLDVYVTDFSAIRAEAKKRGFIVPDGVLGGSWFAGHQCVIDFKRDILYFRDPKTQLANSPPIADQDSKGSQNFPAKIGENDEEIGKSPLTRALLDERYSYLKLIRGPRDPELYMKCTANGKPLCLQIDSGASAVCISRETATRLGLGAAKTKNEFAWLGSKPMGTAETWLIGLKLSNGDNSISLGGVPVVDLSGLRVRAKQVAGIELDGLYSAQQLSLFSCVLDYRQGVLFHRFLLARTSNPYAGSWQASKLKRYGKIEPIESTSQWELNSANNHLQLQGPAATWNCVLVTTSDSLHGIIDCTLQSKKKAEFTTDMHGIFEFDGSTDRLRICLSADSSNRPSRFESTESNKAILIEFERATK